MKIVVSLSLLLMIAGCQMNKVELTLPTVVPEVNIPIRGRLDKSFGTNGAAILAVTSGVNINYDSKDRATSFSLLPSGEILLSGVGSNFGPATGASANSDGYTVKLNSIGTLDPSYNGTGILPMRDSNGRDGAYKILEDGIYYYVLGRYSSTGDCYIARFGHSGVIDSTYGTAGESILPIGGTNCHFHDAVVDDAGRVIATFSFTSGAATRYGISRITASGSLDTTFGAIATPGHNDFIGSSDQTIHFTKIRRLVSGKYLIQGTQKISADTFRIFLTRIETNGLLDTSFGIAGTASFIKSGSVSTYAYSFDLDGDKIVIPIAYRDNTTEAFKGAVTRRNEDGSLDTSFGTAGFSDILPSYLALGYEFTSVKVIGKNYYVGGFFNYQVGTDPVRPRAIIQQLYDTGKPESAFGESGLFIFNLGSIIKSKISFLQGEGSYLVGCGTGSSADADDDVICMKVR